MFVCDEVALEFVQTEDLAVGSRPTGNVASLDSGVWVTLYDNVEDAHTELLRFSQVREAWNAMTWAI